LPDGIFSYQKYQLGCISESLGMENVGAFYGDWEYFTHTIWNILWLLLYFYCFGLLHYEKSGNLGPESIL
jgi:hypothetical protein